MYHSEDYKQAGEPKRRELIGNIIYDHVERLGGQMKAPKICGMLIDLPFVELCETIASLEHLEQKIKVADDLLSSAINTNNHQL